MNEVLHSALLKCVERLKKIISDVSLGDLLNLLNINQRGIPSKNVTQQDELSSPYQQSIYLLGIALSQPQSEKETELNEEKYKEIVSLLNEIFSFYAIKYFDKDLDRKKAQVVMPAFSDYFFTGLNMSTTQAREWIADWYSPYDNYLLSNFSFSTNDLLVLGENIELQIINKLNNHDEIFNAFERFKQDKNEIKKMGDNFKEMMLNFMTEIKNLHIVEISNVSNTNNFKSIANQFGARKGEVLDITYITDINTLDLQPLIIDENFIYYPKNNMYYIGIINFLEQEIYKNHPESEKNRKTRDKKLEETTTTLFKQILGDEPIYFESLCDEHEGKRFEHDLIICHRDTLLIVEAKASAPKEPMRDLERAFTKIRDHFRSSSGLQKAFDQANNFKNRLLKKDRIQLFDGKKLIVELNKNDYKNIFCICITRDDYKSLGCLINYMLDKEENDKYPWVSDISNLKNIAMAWQHLELSSNDFYIFLEQRLQLYGKVIGTDELEYVGSFLEYHGGLKGFIDAKADMIPLSIEASDIFDEIWFKELDGEKYILEKKKLQFDTLYNSPDLIKKNRKPTVTKKKKALIKKSRRSNRK